MSISNRHTVNLFVAGKSAPLSDQRLARVGYKSSKATPAKFPSICLSVPALDMTSLSSEQMNALKPFIRGMLENAQDGIIKSLYESSDGSLGTVSDDDISVDSCISFMISENEGGRLTSALLENWFDTQMLDNLTVVISEKLGFDLSTPEQVSTVQKHTNSYRALISSLAGGKTMLAVPQIQGLKRALECSSVEDEIAGKLKARLVAMENKPKMANLLEL